MKATSEIEFSKPIKKKETPIEGLVVYDLTVHGDNRGWFKENWQREKMAQVGLPDFHPVQNNVSFNVKKGVTRGLHAEPWDKFVSVGSGAVFGAWVDLRKDSKTYGHSFTCTLDPSKAIYVPRGVANGFQTLEDNTVYMYLVNDHWSPDGAYSFVNLADKTLNIDWPIPLSEVELSEKDKNHPMLKDATAIDEKKVLIIGANGQLGHALALLYPEAECVDKDTLDITSNEIFTARRWKDYKIILNAAAFTAVDLAETEGKRMAWKINAEAVAKLSKIATENDILLVHISTDYVFDGTKEDYTEQEDFAPLSVYGQTKAAGDIAANMTPRHYIIRTSWVIGEGKNFVLTMKALADKGVQPNVVNDQIGRLTFTKDLAEGIKHLIDTQSPYGTYNLTNDGPATSWAAIAKQVYTLNGHPETEVTGVSTAEYYKDKTDVAPRPLNSTLSLGKIKATGFNPRLWDDALKTYWQTIEEKN